MIANMVDPNVTPIFEHLARVDGVELLVLYESLVEPNRKWTVPELGFDHDLLPSRTIDLRRIHPDAFLHLTHGVRRRLKKFKPDMVVGRGSGIWSSPANIAAWTGRKRHGWLFVPSWESFARESPTLIRRLASPWVKRFLRSSDAVMAGGTAAKNYLIELGVSPDHIVVGPVSFPLSTQPAVAPAHDEARTKKRILFVGRLVVGKGLDVLIAAFEQIDGGELWIAGDGELRENVEQAAKRDARIKILGHLPKDTVLDLYSQVDLLAVPSRREVWGLVVNEALSRGIPVVATDQVGAAMDLIEPGVTGEIVAVDSIDAMRDGVESVSAWTDEQFAICRAHAPRALEPWGLEAATELYKAAYRVARGSNRSSAVGHI